jgi:hypothetical protein
MSALLMYVMYACRHPPAVKVATVETDNIKLMVKVSLVTVTHCFTELTAPPAHRILEKLRGLD